ncbi:MAG TPA: DUF6337 family protein [Terriglobales bacterium]|nr:DUF6337 family protein [Terriglobales bacterium]
MEYFVVVCLIVEVFVLSRLDRRIFGTWFTPFNLLGYPYMAVVISAFLFAPVLNFVPVYWPSMVIWIVGLFLFWISGLTVGLVSGFRLGPRVATSEAELMFRDAPGIKVAIRIAWGLMPLMALGFYRSQVLAGGWSEIGTLDFKTAYVHGLPGHAVQLAQPLCVFLLGTYKRGRTFLLLTIVGLFLFLFLTQVKGTILSVVIAALVFRAVRENTRILVKKIAVGLVLTYVLFNAVYLVAFSVVDSSALTDAMSYEILSRHYFYYLWAGVLSFSQALRNHVGFIGGPWDLVFAPFLNMYRAMLGSGPLLVAVSPLELGMDIDPTTVIPDSGANVYTMFGTLYFYLGPAGAALLVLIVGALCYGIFVFSRTRDNGWLLVLHCIVGSWLVFGFFDYYFWSLGFPETAVDCVFMAALVRWVRSRRGGIVLSKVQSDLVSSPI